jgi:hypothetical protein
MNETEIKFWAALGSLGCTEKTLPTAISMQILGLFFQLLQEKKKNF